MQSCEVLHPRDADWHMIMQCSYDRRRLLYSVNCFFQAHTINNYTLTTNFWKGVIGTCLIQVGELHALASNVRLWKACGVPFLTCFHRDQGGTCADNCPVVPYARRIPCQPRLLASYKVKYAIDTTLMCHANADYFLVPFSWACIHSSASLGHFFPKGFLRMDWRRSHVICWLCWVPTA